MKLLLKGKAALKSERVAIGLPVFNGAQTLARSLDSLISQKYENFQVIVLDNESDDESTLIANHYADIDKRVRSMSLERVDAANNFSRVFELCDSSMFMWAADDDSWDDNFLQAGVEHLREKTDYFSSNWWVGDIASSKGHATPEHPLGFLGGVSKSARTLNFANLHHSSHKCNLIYALYRVDFLRQILARQSIANDGVFTNLVASEGQGSFTNDVLFKKQFISGFSSRVMNTSKIPQGLRDALNTKILSRSEASRSFGVQKEASLELLLGFYPELESELRRIFSEYSLFAEEPFIIDKGLWLS